MTITINIQNGHTKGKEMQKSFDSVLEAVHFLTSTQLEDDIDRIQESEKNKEAFESSLTHKNDVFTVQQAKELIWNTK